MYVERYFRLIETGLRRLVLVDLNLSTQISNAFKTRGCVEGYVNGARIHTGGEAHGRIHIDFGKLAQTDTAATMIIHEASHKFCGTRDYAYSPKWKILTANQAKENADSYAYFAMTPQLTYNT